MICNVILWGDYPIIWRHQSGMKSYKQSYKKWDWGRNRHHSDQDLSLYHRTLTMKTIMDVSTRSGLNPNLTSRLSRSRWCAVFSKIKLRQLLRYRPSRPFSRKKSGVVTSLYRESGKRGFGPFSSTKAKKEDLVARLVSRKGWDPCKVGLSLRK